MDTERLISLKDPKLSQLLVPENRTDSNTEFFPYYAFADQVNTSIVDQYGVFLRGESIQANADIGNRVVILDSISDYRYSDSENKLSGDDLWGFWDPESRLIFIENQTDQRNILTSYMPYIANEALMRELEGYPVEDLVRQTIAHELVHPYQRPDIDKLLAEVSAEYLSKALSEGEGIDPIIDPLQQFLIDIYEDLMYRFGRDNVLSSIFGTGHGDIYESICSTTAELFYN